MFFPHTMYVYRSMLINQNHEPYIHILNVYQSCIHIYIYIYICIYTYHILYESHIWYLLWYLYVFSVYVNMLSNPAVGRGIETSGGSSTQHHQAKMLRSQVSLPLETRDCCDVVNPETMKLVKLVEFLVKLVLNKYCGNHKPMTQSLRRNQTSPFLGIIPPLFLGVNPHVH